MTIMTYSVTHSAQPKFLKQMLGGPGKSLWSRAGASGDGHKKHHWEHPKWERIMGWCSAYTHKTGWLRSPRWLLSRPVCLATCQVWTLKPHKSKSEPKGRGVSPFLLRGLGAGIDVLPQCWGRRLKLRVRQMCRITSVQHQAYASNRPGLQL